MSSFRPGRGHSESRRTVFYTSEEWELLDPPPKDLEESLLQEERKKQMPEGSKGRECTCALLLSVLPFVTSGDITDTWLPEFLEA